MARRKRATNRGGNPPSAAKRLTRKKRQRRPRAAQERAALTPDGKLPRTRGNSNRLTKGTPGTGLSKCAELYLKAQINPWGTFEELPCVPCAPAVESRKYRCVTRGTLTTSSSNVYGFLSYCPSNPANDQNSVGYTNGGASTATGFTQTTQTGVAFQARSGLPYATADFSSAGDFMQAKLVGSGVRIRNVTPRLYRGGICFGMRVSDFNQLSNIAIAVLQAMPETVMASADPESPEEPWQSLTWKPSDMTDLDYPEQNVNYGAAPNNNHSVGFWIVAPSGSNGAQTFEWEIVEFWEFVGTGNNATQPGLTSSHADEVGLSRVLEATQMVQTGLNIDKRMQLAAESVVESVANSDTVSKTIEDMLGIVGIGGGMAGTMIKSLVSMLAA